MEFQLSYFKSSKMMLWKGCTQYASKFGNPSSGHRTGKGQFSFQSQRKAIPKNIQTISLISDASKVILKILQAKWTMNFQMFKLDLEKAEEPEIKLPTSVESLKKQSSSRKISISALLTMPKPLCGSQQTGKFFKRWEYQITWPASWETTLMAESKEELKSLLMKVKEESEKVDLKLNIQEAKIMVSGPITSWQIDGEAMKIVTDFILGGSKITGDGDCSHEIKRHLLLGRKAMTKLDRILKSRDIILPTKVCLVNAVLPVVMYGCESWTLKKAEYQRIDAFELWC